ncbi:hypothetical protein IC235_05420 [Hymenobacter sp. BT664]|uniref:Uncharacterized protein n=1 Tax=Hymenobacter montanus TaxID=2771359 RepID=A0A927BC20_9BACT|nr:hypothetical protein [Hymenobacter montanus]MBD2767327.1 hypothetical protein [Hymenobacter montanus]
MSVQPSNFTNDHEYMIDYAQSGLRPNELYRLYYVLYNNGMLLHKGHGDVRYSN